MAADLLDERHDCGADAPQGAEYTPDGTLCVLEVKVKRAGDAVGGARTPLDDIIRGSAALDALDSNLLRVQQNDAYSPIVGRRAGCATPPVGDTSIFPVLRDDSGLYTPLEPSDSTPTQKIEHSYQIPHSPSEPTTSNDRLPTKAPKTTNAPEHGTVNATEPSKATACKGAPGDPTKSGSICQSINFLPSETISIAYKQDTKSSVPTSQTKERQTQLLDAHGFPDICASTSTAGQAVGNDSAGGYSGGSDTPCATPIVHLATDDDVWYGCLPTDQDILDEDTTVSYPTKFGHADAVEISAEDGFLDGGASRDTPRIFIPGSLDGKASPESPASMYYTPEEITNSIPPTFADATTPVDVAGYGKQVNRAQKSSSRSRSSYVPFVNDDTITSPASATAPAPAPVAPRPENRATGADLPEELFDPIIDGVIAIAVWGKSSFVERNQFVGACSLACRYWAKRLRAWNFSDMRISSERRIESLESLLDYPHTGSLDPLASLIRCLKIIHNGSCAPWIHRVTHLMSKHPCFAEKTSLELELSHYGLTCGGHPFRSIFYYLPRSPPSVYQNFHDLVLKDTTFATPHDLFALIREFRNLRWLSLVDVTWCTPSPLSLAPPSLPETLRGIDVRQPTNATWSASTAFWVIAASVALTPNRHSGHFPTNARPHTSPISSQKHRENLRPTLLSDVIGVLDMLEAFNSIGVALSSHEMSSTNWSIRRTPPSDREAEMYVDIVAMASTNGLPMRMSPDISLRLRTPVTEEAPSRSGNLLRTMNSHIQGIRLNFEVLDGCSADQLIKNIDWTLFFSSTLSLRQLGEVEFQLASREDREIVCNAHATLLDELLRVFAYKMSRRYRYGVRACYSRDTRDSEDIIISTA